MEIQSTNLPESNGKGTNKGRFLTSFLLGITGIATALVVMVVSVSAALTASESASEIPIPVVEATQEAVVAVEYYLPYPGILPDNPLYKLKAIRDRVKLWITFDESQKASLELSLADKRINAALALAEGNKVALAVTTATKAEKYLELSTNRVIKLIKLGKDENSQLLTLEKAIAKHGQLLESISNKAGEGDTGTLGESKMLNKLLGERVGQTVIEVIK